jgi:uncharacterized oxidoreductase
MQLSGNTVLVTGGASGIGLAIANRFLDAGSRVVACGRREEKLREAQATRPELETFACDLASVEGRVALVERVSREYPSLNVLVNNAGIQRYPRLADQEDWDLTHEEIAINLEAPIHLSRLLIPHLLRQARPAIVNVTSGLAFVPLARVPIYCATKAALHSFTQSLRHQLAATPIAVLEIIPPAVDTDLGGPGLHTFGVDVNEFADAAMARIAEGAIESAYGFAEQSSRASRAELDQIFSRMNQPDPRTE